MFLLSNNEIEFKEPDVVQFKGLNFSKDTKILIPMIDQKDFNDKKEDEYFGNLSECIDDYKLECIIKGDIDNPLLDQYLEVIRKFTKCNSMILDHIHDGQLQARSSEFLTSVKKFYIRADHFMSFDNPTIIQSRDFKEVFPEVNISMICDTNNLDEQTPFSDLSEKFHFMKFYHESFKADTSMFISTDIDKDDRPKEFYFETRYANIAWAKMDDIHIYYIIPKKTDVIQFAYFNPDSKLEMSSNYMAYL